MKRYLVFEPPLAEAARGPVFVRDAFSVWGFLFTFLWLFYHRLWLAGLAALVLVVGFAWVDNLPGWAFAVALIEVAFGVLVGLEGPSLVAAKWRRRGWDEVAAINAADLDEAELRYFAGKEASVEGVSPSVDPSAPVVRPSERPVARSRSASYVGGFFESAKAR